MIQLWTIHLLMSEPMYRGHSSWRRTYQETPKSMSLLNTWSILDLWLKIHSLANSIPWLFHFVPNVSNRTRAGGRLWEIANSMWLE